MKRLIALTLTSTFLIFNFTTPQIAQAWTYSNATVSSLRQTASLSPQEFEVGESNTTYTTGFYSGTVDVDPGSGVSQLTSAGPSNYKTYLLKLTSEGDFLWAVSFGGTGQTMATEISVDTAGNAYLSGSFNSTTDFDPGAGVSSVTPAGGYDAFLAKFNSSGALQWVKKWGSDIGDERCEFVQLTSNTVVNVVCSLYPISGNPQLDLDPGAGSNFQYPGGVSYIMMFLVTLDSAGIYQRGFVITDTDGFAATGIAADSSGNLHIVGIFTGSVWFYINGGGSQLTTLGSYDIFYMKLNTTGRVVVALQVGSANTESGAHVAISAAGEAFITGDFRGDINLAYTGGSGTLTFAGAGSVFLIKLNSSGTYQWAMKLSTTGGSAYDKVLISSTGDIYWAGSMYGSFNLDPTGVNTNVTSSASGYGTFLIKLASNRTFIWSRTWIGSGDVTLAGLAKDSDNNILLSAWHSGSVDLDPGSQVITSSVGSYEGSFLARLTPLGIVEYRLQAEVSALSLAGGVSSASYRRPIVLTATVSIASKVTFSINGKRLPGCIARPTTGSSPTFIASCTWNPSARGAFNLTATATPTALGALGGVRSIPVAITVRNTRR